MIDQKPSSVDGPIVELRGVAKSYGAVRALHDGDIALRAGEVRALMGENGAGKSTLVKVLGGVVRRDDGEMLVDGAAVDFHSPHDARDAGIAVIYQEPTLFPDLSVEENVVMGYHPLGSLRRIDRGAVRRTVSGLLDRLGVRLDPERPVRGLSIADQQIVEIAKALSFDARVLIMDEPTAALSGPEVERLFTVVRALREEGAAILFISHRLDEVFAICDTVTVMRDGAVVHDAPIAAMTPDEMVRRMVGRELSALYPKQDTQVGDTVLSVQRLTREGVFADVSLEVRAGEVVALAGLVGAGRSEVARAIFGIDKPDAGRVEVDGKRLAAGRPLAAMRAGIGFVPEDRRQQGLVMDLSIARNATMTRTSKLARFGLIRRAAENELAREWAARLQLRFHRLDDPAGFLSGGNQQKVVLAKWLATEPRLLIVDEPTRGIDVGTKAEVHRLIGRARRARRRGADDLERAARGARRRRPRAGHARGPAGRGAVAGRGGRGARDPRRHRPDRGGRMSAATAPAEGARARRLTEWVFRVRELGIIVVLALLIAVTAIIEPRFIEADSLRNLALNASIFAILAAGQTLVLVTRNVDLSVGSVLGLAAYFAGDLLSAHPGMPLPLVFVLGMALGAACGLLNGVLVTWGQVPALVVTLGTLYAFRGLAFLWTDGRQVNAETLPDSFLNLGSDSIAGIPILVIFALVVLVIVGQWLRDYRAGRELYAIGSNPEGARLAGVRSGRRVLTAFVLSGMLAGLGGVLFTARFGTVDATAGTGYELTVIAAAVVGGVAIFGGTGSVYGAALGALLLGTITSSLIVLRVEAFWQQAAIGALLLIAIAFDRLVGLRVDAALRRRSARRVA